MILSGPDFLEQAPHKKLSISKLFSCWFEDRQTAKLWEMEAHGENLKTLADSQQVTGTYTAES